jgi:homoserine O-acetyltransferase
VYTVTEPGQPLAATGERLSLGDFRTSRGDVLRDAWLGYRVFGDTAAAARNGWILVFHALTGSPDVDAWWGPLLGPGAPLDTSRHAVIAANLPGSCYGSIGPADTNGTPFPALTPEDMARAHVPLLEHLGVERLSLVAGGSLGGMVALAWGTVSPVPVDRLVVFAAPAATSAQAIAWNAAQRMAIEADSRWQGGHFAPGAGPVHGLAAARAIAMITYRSGIEFDERFGRASTRNRARFDVEQYLRRQGEKLVERFDARSYVALMAAMDAHDVGDLAVAGARTRERVREVVGVGIDTDILYYPDEVRSWVSAYRGAGVNARYEEISSPYGHDAFLIEWDQVGALLRDR